MKTPAEKRAANRARQARFRENNPRTPKVREEHAKASRRSYYKKRAKAIGSGSVAERLAIKEASLKPATLARKKTFEKTSQERLAIFHHYRTLLSSLMPHNRRAALAWFRAIHNETNPYTVLNMATPSNMIHSELEAPTPFNWRFSATELSKNYHPTTP